jgi:hypothetical protein
MKSEDFNYETIPYSYNYVNGDYKIPACYSSDAAKYGQSAYFVGVVIVQISDIFACKCKKMPSIYSTRNEMILWGLFTEVSVAIFLCYVRIFI